MSLGVCNNCDEGSLVFRDNRVLCNNCGEESPVYVKELTASDVKYKIIVVEKNGQFIFPDEDTEIKFVTSQGEYQTDLRITRIRPLYKRIHAKEFTKWVRENAENFKVGKRVRFSRLSEESYFVEIVEDSEESHEVVPQIETPAITNHIDLIAKLYRIGKCDENKYIFIGRQERSRVEQVVSEESIDLPSWLMGQSETTGNDRIDQIDCVFMVEDDGLFKPKVVFEVELSNNYDPLIYRINSLIGCLDNRWYQDILRELFVVIIVPDDKKSSLQERITSQRQWREIVDNVNQIKVWKVSELDNFFRSLVEDEKYDDLSFMF